MTLAALAAHICATVNQNETEDLTQCKAYLQRRHEMIWAEGLWKDSLFEYTQTLSSSGYVVTSTWLPTKKTLLLPTQFTHVVAIRTDTRRLEVESSETFYRQDLDAFASTGTAMKYRLLAPAVWEFDTARELYLYRASGTDATLAVTTDALAEDAVTIDRDQTTLTNQTMDVGTVQRIDKISKAVSAGEISLVNAIATAITNEGTTVTIFILSSDGVAWDTVLPNLSVGDSTFAFTPAAYIIAIDQIARPAVAIPDGAAFSGNITYNGAGSFTFTSLVEILTLATTDTVALKRQRVQLFGTVPEAAVIRVLGKIKPPTFTDDSDEPGVTGIENCLLAFGMADMLTRERQYGKAQVKTQEAAALLEQLKRVQTTQQAYHKRFIPSSGYGDDWGLTGGGDLCGKF